MGGGFVTFHYNKLLLSTIPPLISKLPGEVEEVDTGTINTVLVNEAGSNPAGEHSPLVGFGESLQQLIQPNLLDEGLGDRLPHDTLPAGDIIEKIRVFQLRLKIVQSARQFIRDDCTRLRS